MWGSDCACLYWCFQFANGTDFLVICMQAASRADRVVSNGLPALHRKKKFFALCVKLYKTASSNYTCAFNCVAHLHLFYGYELG